MKTRTKEELINNFDEITMRCIETDEPVLITDDNLVLMSTKAYKSSKKIALLTKELYEIEVDRLNNKNFVSLDDAKEILDKATK